MSGVHSNGQPLAPAQLRSAAADLRAVVQESVVTVTSPEHAVTVTVGPGNAVMELLLSQRAFRYDGDTLGAVVVETIREAGRQVDEALAERARELTRGRVDVAGLLGGVLPEPPATGTGDVPGASSGGTADDPGPEPLTALEAETEEKVRRLAEEADRQVAAYAEAQAAAPVPSRPTCSTSPTGRSPCRPAPREAPPRSSSRRSTRTRPLRGS
ncbi:YbaB/EbfC family nucleoid-associated protein [Micromonospora sp. NPDC048830]|uniref:YbaB/EbfC family nucleoid-associated protein n=1 Tax=Micromonospora sp. NPDC048830 TaxID=3364257 RepID=UPI0037111F05